MAAPAEPAAGDRRRARRAGLALSIGLPAALAAILTLALGGPEAQPAPAGSAKELARLADRPSAVADPLQPLLSVSGRVLLDRTELRAAAAGVRPAVPARVTIPALRLNAVVEPVGAQAGAVGIPAVGRAGWYRDGPRPGEAGHAVVVGHLDTRRGPGLFARVPSLRSGALVTVHDRLGGIHRYRVVGGATVAKHRFPAHAVYGPSSRPVLVLVTCGGPFRRGRGYRDNVLVYARAA